MRSRLHRLGYGLRLALMMAWVLGLPRGIRGAEGPAAPPAAAQAPGTSQWPAKHVMTSSPSEPDPTGASYTGANSAAALTGPKDETTGAIRSDLATLSADVKLLKTAINTSWMLVAGILVLSLQAGFALVACGLVRAKNVAHTMALIVAITAVGLLGFWICGFALLAGDWGPVVALDGPDVLDTKLSLPWGDRAIACLGFEGFFLAGTANDATVLTLFLFQAVLMATAATIPTGALAERWKFSAAVVYGFVLSMVLYPVYGCWVWGRGWLADLGRLSGLGNGHVDLAGSSVVHMTGGLTALAGAIILGPRRGKFNKDGSANAIPGHNLPLVVLGTLILAVGWFGFNLGGGLTATDLRVGSVAVCTLLATAAGGLGAMSCAWIAHGKPDPTMACNGLLAGAVAIAAPCAFVNPVGAVTIGACAGVLVIGSVRFVETVLKVDDPVGAVSVHGVCGAFGCLSVGLFATGEYGRGWNRVADKAPIGVFYDGPAGLGQLAAEVIGVAVNVLWVFPVALAFFWIVEQTMGNRVTAREEVDGLDIPEMGVLGYHDADSNPPQAAGWEHPSTAGTGGPKGRKNGRPPRDRLVSPDPL